VQSVCRPEAKVAVLPDPLPATTPQTYKKQDQNIAHDPIIDHDRVTEMVEDFGADVFAEIVSSFAEEVTTALQALNTALTAKDIEEIRKLLHLIEGCASNVGAIGLCALCDEIRTQVTAGNTPTAQDPFSALHAETCRILKQHAAA
jgi:HPt (histidine-containing phosphotransfer) domain-containing protein